MTDDLAAIHATRQQLIDAIATMSLPGVPKWGAQSPAEWAERLADGIIGQLAPVIIRFDRTVSAEELDRLRDNWRAAYERDKHLPPRILTEPRRVEIIPLEPKAILRREIWPWRRRKASL